MGDLGPGSEDDEGATAAGQEGNSRGSEVTGCDNTGREMEHNPICRHRADGCVSDCDVSVQLMDSALWICKNLIASIMVLICAAL